MEMEEIILIRRPTSFDEVIGHPQFNLYFQDHIRDDNMPQFLILTGPEGLGKSALADLIAIGINYGLDDSPDKRKAIEDVIVKNRSTDCIKKFNMAKTKGTSTAKEVLAELNITLSPTGRKVVICDECHQLEEDAQDTFLVDTEYLPHNTYLIMCTTDIRAIKPALQSRALTISLSTLKSADMVVILQKAVEERHLKIQGGDTTLRLIASWADGKPRNALSILDAFSNGQSVSTDMINAFIGYLDVDEVIPLITCLGGSMTAGLTYISEMKLSDSIVDITIEILRLKLGQPSYKVSFSNARMIREALEGVPEASIVKFLHQIAGAPRLTRAVVISAFVSSCVTYKELMMSDDTVLATELGQKAEAARSIDLMPRSDFKGAPSFAGMLASSGIVDEENA